MGAGPRRDWDSKVRDRSPSARGKGVKSSRQSRMLPPEADLEGAARGSTSEDDEAEHFYKMSENPVTRSTEIQGQRLVQESDRRSYNPQ